MNNGNVISHQTESTDLFAVIVERIAQRITNTGDRPYVTVLRQLKLLEELTLFPFGRFLLENRGINGYWTYYMVMHPQRGRLTGLNSEGQSFTELETFLLDSAPTLLATQQRFVHFQKHLQHEVKNNRRLSSIPCGLMGELLTLDLTQIDHVKLVGIDLDQTSLNASESLAKNLGLSDFVEYFREDAWQLSVAESFDVITSNGLNIYEPDDEKVTELYKQFYLALAPKGTLVTSFVTPPPDAVSKDKTSTWDLSKINLDNLLLQKILFSDIIDAQWQCFRTVEQTEKQLRTAGFSQVEFINDDANMFPTVIAKK